MSKDHELAAPDLSFLSNGTCTATPHGLIIHRPLSKPEWMRLIKTLRDIKCSYLSYLADATRHGIEQFGREEVAQELEQLEFDLQDATKADAIAMIPLELRTKHGLSSEHSFILATCLDDDRERAKWAATVAREKLDPYELKSSIKAGRILRRAEIGEASGGGSGGIQTVQSVRFTYERWLRAAGDKNAILSKPAETRREILRQLEPMVELAAEIEQSLH